ncbi:MAG: ATP-dependent helicase [Azospirillum sp.]|nr:ATP-dependent helicase [Azospirillum sp.]
MTVKAKRINIPTRGDRAAVRAKSASPTFKTAFSEGDLDGVFDRRAVERGRHLAQQGVVALDDVTSENRFSAAVADGRFRQRVAVQVLSRKDGILFVTQCSCRVANCAHAAAAAFTLLNKFPELRRPHQDSFLDRLAPPAAAEQRAIVYGLDVEEDDGALYVTVFNEIRTGAAVRLVASSPKRAAQADGAGELDRDICGLLGNSSLPLVAISLDQDEQVDQLVDRLAESRRCRWQPTGVTLSKGHEKRFLVERNARTGAWHVLNPPPRIRLIRSEVPWYVNEASGKVGPAEVEVVSTEGFTPSAETPKPSQATYESPVIVPGTAVPVLVAASSQPGGGADSEGLDALLLQFDYGDRRVREDEPGQFARVDGDGGTVFIRRDRRAEEQAANTLRTLGLSAVRIATDGGTGDTACRGYAFRTRSAMEAWAEFIMKEVEGLRRKGWRIDLGQQFQYRVIDIADDWDIEVFEVGHEWFSLDVGIEVEGRRYPLLPILIGMIERGGMSALRTEDGKVRAMLDDGRILALPAERVAKFLGTLQEILGGGRLGRDGRLNLSTAEAPALVDLEDIVGTRWHGATRLLDLGRRLRAFDHLERVDPPAGFKAQLRPYQCDGLDWLQFLRANDMAGILADDMGLGKTAQTLAHIAVERHTGRMDRPCLIVVPTSLVPNWTAEAARFVPDLSVLVFHGLDRHQRRSEVASSDLVVTTYAIVARDVEFLAKIEFHLIVLDEAQSIKNPAAKATKAVCKLKARHRLCLTGTPIENHLGEVWSQFAFLMPGILGDQRSFTTRFRTPIEKHGDTERRTQLAHRLRPFMLRRTKAEVATDLPPKTEIMRRVELATDQRDLYETIRLSMHQKVREEVARLGIGRSRIVILDALLKLRQVCCDPRLVKLKSAQKVTGSGKLETLMEMLPEMIEEGRRILLFSQFTSMLDLIKEALVPTGIPYVELRGDTADRATPVLRFQACEVPLFLISLKAGGKGLNLTAADTVIHYDPWWNPAIENQATDRAHRIGQDKPVFVYKMIAAGTVEEKIVELQEKKGALANAMLDEGTWVGQIDTNDLDYLFQGGDA